MLESAPAVQYLNYYNNILNLNESFVTAINERADACGYTAFMELALTFPPAGKFPAPTSLGKGNLSRAECDVLDDIYEAALYVNPCFNFYHITGETLEKSHIFRVSLSDHLGLTCDKP